MSQSPDSARALRAEKRRKEPSSTSGFSNLTRHISQSIRIRRKSNQLDKEIGRMSPSQNKQRNKRTPSTMDNEQPTTNGNTGVPHVAPPRADLGPLTQDLRGASEQLSNIQKAIRTITESCIQHADEITQIPVFREKYENLQKETEEKDKTIERLQTAFGVFEERAAAKDEAATAYAKANSTERERLEDEKAGLDEQKRAVSETLKRRKLELEIEASKALSQREAKQDESFLSRQEQLKADLKKRENDQKEKLVDLEEKHKKAQQKISQLNGQISTLQTELKDETRKHKDTDKAKEGYKQDIEELEEKLEGLQKEFSLNGKPLEYYQGEFLNTSRAIQDIAVKYLARDLSKEEVRRLPRKISAADSMFSDVPFSSSETSKQLRVAHAQRVIADALSSIVWQPFSSDITTADSKLPEILRCIGAAVNSGRSADVWRVTTMRALESMSAANTRAQHSSPTELTASYAIKSRKDKLVELVLSVLDPLLDRSELVQFKTDLSQIAEQAISVWTIAQADERTFTVNPTLNQDNKRDWKIVDLDNVSLSVNSGGDVVGSGRRDMKGIFTLFPIITTTKQVQVQKLGNAPPGSWPNQDHQPLSDAEVTLVHEGLGLPQESDIVQEGIAERDYVKKMRLEHDELLDLKIAQTIAENSHSRKNSMTGTKSGPSSPSESWGMNKLNNHKTDN
ncbi:hypothetical protein V494_00550 [Pseudogymnoascus sp. VKM F-4513 (FW-928)]|nr:hypothetical protein V494_00550 [Pseudogymnoascus sp. VKM F-4513 (FW-928)]